jgi:hypothetical protein
LPLRGSGTRTVDPVLENVVKKADEIDLESPLLGQRRDVRGVRRRKGLRDEVDIRQHKRSPTAEDELLESVLQTAVVQSVR